MGEIKLKDWKKEITAQRILAFICLVLVIVFVIQNRQRAELTFIFFSIKLPFILWVVILYGVGIATGWAINRSRGKKIQEKEATNSELEDV